MHTDVAVGELAEAGVSLVHVANLPVVGGVAAVCAGDEADEGEEEEEEEEKEEELTRPGPLLLVWAHNSGLEMLKFCPVWHPTIGKRNVWWSQVDLVNR